MRRGGVEMRVTPRRLRGRWAGAPHTENVWALPQVALLLGPQIVLLAGASDRELPAAIAATSPRPATARVRGQAATEGTRGTRALAHPRTRKPTLWGELMRTSQPQDVEATVRRCTR